MKNLSALIWYYNHVAINTERAGFLHAVPYGPRRMLKYFTHQEAYAHMRGAAADLPAALACFQHSRRPA